MTRKRSNIQSIPDMSLKELMERKPDFADKVRDLVSAMEHAKKYPNCDRLSAVMEEKTSIEGFLEWVKGREIELCFKPFGLEHFYPMAEQEREVLLLKYFEINPSALEKERREILEAQREMNKK